MERNIVDEHGYVALYNKCSDKEADEMATMYRHKANVCIDDNGLSKTSKEVYKCAIAIAKFDATQYKTLRNNAINGNDYAFYNKLYWLHIGAVDVLLKNSR